MTLKSQPMSAGVTLHKLDRVMEGDLDGLLNSVFEHFQAERLKAL